MPSLVDQLGSLFSSIFHAITAVLGSIVAVFQSIFNAILGVIQTAFAALGTAASGLVQTFEGLFKFLLSEFHPKMKEWYTGKLTSDEGNIVVIGGLVAAFFLYAMYQQRNGRPVTAAPAKNKKIQ
jgi:phage-related protein